MVTIPRETSYRNLASLFFVSAALFMVACGAEVQTAVFTPEGDWQGWLTAGLDPEQSLLVAGKSAAACRERLGEHCAAEQGELSPALRVAEIRGDGTAGFLCSAACTKAADARLVQSVTEGNTGALRGWNLLQPSYTRFNLLDGVSLEWDYFMVHDRNGRFTGSVGYLLADPRGRLDGIGRLPGLVPSGMNAAIAGSFDGGDQVAEFKNFRTDESEYSAAKRSTFAQNGNAYARMVPVFAKDGEPDHLLLQGRTDRFEWNLHVRQDWSERGGFEPVHAHDVGLVPGEHWTVEMVWPRTLVQGQITDLDTGITVEIDGHGYRENSWGRWAFVAGGWDFAVVSDEESGVQWAWQTYHFTSKDLDFLDLSLLEEGKPVKVHFNHGQIGWQHPEWRYDGAANQCVPLNGIVVAANDDYRVEVELSIQDDQVAMLSDLTVVTRIYFIMIQFPFMEGRVENLHTGAITHFSGRGGGEFSLIRGLLPKSESDCARLFGEVFTAPMP